MTVSLESKIPQLARDIENAVARAVALGTAELGRNIKEMLSKPGRGRVYAKQSKTGVSYTRIRNKKGESIRVQYDRVRRSRSARSITRRLGLRGASFSRQQVAQAIRQARAAGVRIKRADRTAFWRASAPGDPPAVRTGNLRRSWQTAFKSATPGKVGNKYRVSIGSNLAYAAYLEFGTRSIRERPYLRPAAAAFRPRMQQIVSEQLDRALAKYRGKR